MAEPKIVEAVFTSGNSGVLGAKSPLAKLIEKAMADAVVKALADGITDPDDQRELILAARADAKARYNEAVAKALAESNLPG